MGTKSVAVGLGLRKDTEIKKIPGIPEMYHAGSDGRIYSYSNAPINKHKPNPFKLAETKNDNYYLVTIFNKRGKRTYAVHKLICLAFHGEKPFARACVRHLDGNWANNIPSNLCWGTYAENEADKRRHGRTAMGSRQGSAKLTEEAVKIIRASIPKGLWNTKDAAEVFGVDSSTIRRIARGVGWNHVDSGV